MSLGSGIQKKAISYPVSRVKKAPDPRSVSATLLKDMDNLNLNEAG
jgi:hypothetical protein